MHKKNYSMTGSAAATCTRLNLHRQLTPGAFNTSPDWQLPVQADALESVEIEDLIDVVVSTVLDGADPREVYESWNMVFGVSHTRALDSSRQPCSSLGMTSVVGKVAATIRDSSRHYPASCPREGEVVAIAFACDHAFKEQLLVAIEGVAASTKRPLHVFVLSRDHSAQEMDAAARLFPDLTMTWFECDELNYGALGGLIPHTSVATMDRLVLPILLKGVSKVLYQDVDAIPLKDISELYDTELGDSRLAAVSARSGEGLSGYSVLFKNAKRLKLKPRMTFDFLWKLLRNVRVDFQYFNAGILVLNLDRMRADNFIQEFLPWSYHYGLNDQDVMNIYSGGEYLHLDPRWNSRPAQERTDAAWLIHWAGIRKPWNACDVAFRDRWISASLRLQDRVATIESDV